MAEDAPKPTGAPDRELTLTGMLFPWLRDQPVLLSMPGSPLRYLPLFSDKEKLLALMVQAKVPFERIKQVDDGPEFLESVMSDVTIIVDPYYLPSGRVRFQQVRVG